MYEIHALLFRLNRTDGNYYSINRLAVQGRLCRLFPACVFFFFLKNAISFTCMFTGHVGHEYCETLCQAQMLQRKNVKAF